MKTSLVFFGSGPVAAKALDLLSQNFKIEAVITKPQPAHHKAQFPVLKVAEEKKLKAITAQNKQELSNLFSSKPVKSKIGVVIDYGVIINKDVIDYFPLGIVNSHFSLLPEWRGADPITFSILSGQAKTGVSLMLIDENLDTGKLLTYKTLAIKTGDTTPSLTDRLIELSNKLLAEHLPRYIAGDLKPKNQPHPDRATYSRKLTKDDGIIDWTKPAEQIEREIRAYIDWPKSRTELADKEVVITGAHVIRESGIPGQMAMQYKQIIIYCGKQALVIDRLKPAGKNEMSTQAFLAGYVKDLKNK